MSEPFKNYENPIHGAAQEIISGMSALNMEAKPFSDEELEKLEHPRFLSQTDKWVMHAMEHFQEAFRLLSTVPGSGAMCFERKKEEHNGNRKNHK
jgi:predicted ATP-grasp superfamily ATP-dependent carboligase